MTIPAVFTVSIESGNSQSGPYRNAYRSTGMGAARIWA